MMESMSGSQCSSTSTMNLVIDSASGYSKGGGEPSPSNSDSTVTAAPSPKPYSTPATAQLILPTLIETTEPSGESVIPAIPKKGEQQLLSFPNVSSGQEDEGTPASPKNFNPNTISVTSDDPLRTPPRPQIEEKTAATEDNIAPVAPPAVVPPPVVPVALIRDPADASNDQQNTEDDEATSNEEARIKREKLEQVDPCSANGDADRLDLKIEKMKQDDKSPLPGHASDHRVINYHSRPFYYPAARSVPPIQPPGRGYDRRVGPSHGPIHNGEPVLRSSHVRPLSPISHPHHHQQSHLAALHDGHSPEAEGAVLNLARNSYDNSNSVPAGLYDSLSPYHHHHHHPPPAASMHSRAHMYQRPQYPTHVPQSHTNSHYLMTPYHQRPIQTPTSIPVSVVTSGSEHLRKMNANSGMVMNQVDRNIIMSAPVYRNNTAGRRTIPNSVISTGTRTTSRQGVAQHMNGNTSLSLPHPPPLHSQATSLSPNMSLTVSSSSSIEMNGSAMASSMKPPPIPSGNPSKPFMCPICNKNLASKNVYQLHLRSHNGEKPFACNLCGNAFSQKTSLTRHMRSHTGERPFSCQVCAKRFADKERIKIHMRTHTGEKPFSCDTCHKQFSQKSTVKRHMSVHTGEKPFKCRHCGKGFANRGNLVAHEKTHSSPPSLPSSSTHPLTRPGLMSPVSPL